MRLLVKSVFTVVIFVTSLPAFTGGGGLKLTGNLIQGGLAYGQVKPGSKVKINRHWVRVSPAGEFIIGFGRDYPQQATLMVYADNSLGQSHTLNIASRAYITQRIDGLLDAKVNPGRQALKRIHQESADISKARNRDDDRMDFKTGFIWPVRGPVSGVYGSRRILNRQARRPHFGIDIVAPAGTPVVAPAAGLVTYANDDMYFSGGTLVLDHGHHLSSSFLHLHKILVQVGDQVRQGQKIALVGATGRVTGAHLDWRMNWHQQRLDPGLILGLKANSNSEKPKNSRP